jgi:hypothetical protein
MNTCAGPHVPVLPPRRARRPPSLSLRRVSLPLLHWCCCAIVCALAVESVDVPRLYTASEAVQAVLVDDALWIAPRLTFVSADAAGRGSTPGIVAAVDGVITGIANTMIDANDTSTAEYVVVWLQDSGEQVTVVVPPSTSSPVPTLRRFVSQPVKWAVSLAPAQGSIAADGDRTGDAGGDGDRWDGCGWSTHMPCSFVSLGGVSSCSPRSARDDSDSAGSPAVPCIVMAGVFIACGGAGVRAWPAWPRWWLSSANDPKRGNPRFAGGLLPLPPTTRAPWSCFDVPSFAAANHFHQSSWCDVLSTCRAMPLQAALRCTTWWPNFSR